MRKFRYILYLLISLLLSVSMVEAGTLSTSLTSTEFLERETIEEEEEEKESIHSIDQVEDCKYVLDGGKSSIDNSIDIPIKYETFDKSSFTYLRKSFLKYEQTVPPLKDLFILFCCLKLNL